MVVQSSNRILAALSADDYRRLIPELHSIELRHGDSLPHCGDARVYFLERGLCSIGNVMSDGRVIEIATIGSEGIVGVNGITPPSIKASYLHIGHSVARFMLLDRLNRELERRGPLRRLVDRFSRCFIESSLQSAACNRLHTVQHRCARWLLNVRDGLGRTEFELSETVLANALGVKKSKLSVVLKRLERVQTIEFSGGVITIVDPRKLQALSCSCYVNIKRLRDEAVPRRRGANGRANIVQLVSGASCARCQSSANLPHASEHECIVAIDAELRVLFGRTSALHELRRRLVRDRLRVMREYLAVSRQKLS